MTASYSALALAVALTTLSSFIYVAAAFSNDFSSLPSRRQQLMMMLGNSHGKRYNCKIMAIAQQCFMRGYLLFIRNEMIAAFIALFFLLLLCSSASFCHLAHIYSLHCTLKHTPHTHTLIHRVQHKSNTFYHTIILILHRTILQRFGRDRNSPS